MDFVGTALKQKDSKMGESVLWELYFVRRKPQNDDGIGKVLLWGTRKSVFLNNLCIQDY